MPLRRRALFPLFRRARRLGAPLRKVPPCGAGYFLPGQKVTKEPPRVGAEGQDRLRRSCPNDAHPWTLFYGGPIRRAFQLSQRRGWFSRLVSLLLPLPLRVRSSLGVSSIGGKRAFWGGGAQVWLRETRAATWGRPYGQIGTFWGGQMRTPAPTAHPKTLLLFRRARCPHQAVFGRSSVSSLRRKRNRSVGSANSGAETEPHSL